MKRFAFAAALLALAEQQRRRQAPPPANANQVKGTGCVQAGVEAGCLVVKDAAERQSLQPADQGRKARRRCGNRFCRRALQRCHDLHAGISGPDSIVEQRRISAMRNAQRRERRLVHRFGPMLLA